MSNKEIAVRQEGAHYAKGLYRLFSSVKKNGYTIIWKRTFLQTCTQAVQIMPNIIVFAIQGPLVFAKKASAGSLAQANQMAYRLVTGVSTLLSSYDAFTGYQATLTRLSQFLAANSAAHNIPLLDPLIISSGMHCHDLSITTPNRDPLVDDLKLNLSAQTSLLITGQSGVGKSTTLLALAGLWPYATGNVALPPPQQRMFLPQQWYLPPGNLASLLMRDTSSTQDKELAKSLLDQAGLSELSDLSLHRDWSKELSPGQIQRLLLVKAIIYRPQLLFLDEATSALDEDSEEIMYQLLRTYLSETTMVSIGHRSKLVQFHQRILHLNGYGKWKLSAQLN